MVIFLLNIDMTVKTVKYLVKLLIIIACSNDNENI